MAIVRLKIDVSGMVGDEAWRELKQFDQIQSARFGPQFGSGGRCNHPLTGAHNKGEWIGAEIQLQTPLLAQYAVSHYLEQDRVLDADVPFLAAPYRNTAATMMLVQTCASPTLRICCATFPCGLRTRSETMLVSRR